MWLLLLSACGWFGSVEEVAPPGAEPPARFDEVTPSGGGDVVPQPSEASQRRSACARVFTEEDANAAFGAVADVQADCAFEGVRVAGFEMFLRWIPAGGEEVAIVVTPEGCGEGEAAGSFVIRADDAARKACPGALGAVRTLAQSNTLPSGGAPRMDGPSTVGEAEPGPDLKDEPPQAPPVTEGQGAGPDAPKPGENPDQPKIDPETGAELPDEHPSPGK